MRCISLLIAFFIHYVCFTQIPTKILNVKDHIEKINDSFERIIELAIELEDSSRITQVDTLWHYNESNFNNITDFKYWIKQDHFYTQNWYYYKDLQYCISDSVRIYFPIVIQHKNSEIISFEDTAICLTYFYFFSKIKEKKISEINSDNDVYRISVLGDTILEVFTIFQKEKNYLNYKKYIGYYNYFQGIEIGRLLVLKEIEINNKDFLKIGHNFEKLNFMELEPKYSVLPSNILLEGIIKGDFNFTVLNDCELKSKNFKFLSRNLKFFNDLLLNK